MRQLCGFAGLGSLLRFKRRSCWQCQRQWLLELAPLGIRVNYIAPGAIDTPGASNAQMTDEQRAAMLAPIPMKRQGNSEEIANAVLFLASDESSYMTGSTMVVDGGWVAG